MANYFGLAKNAKQVEMIDVVLFGVGGLAHLLPAVLAPVTGFVIMAPVTVQMVVGALMVARVIDMKFIR